MEINYRGINRGCVLFRMTMPRFFWTVIKGLYDFVGSNFIENLLRFLSAQLLCLNNNLTTQCCLKSLLCSETAFLCVTWSHIQNSLKVCNYFIDFSIYRQLINHEHSLQDISPIRELHTLPWNWKSERFDILQLHPSSYIRHKIRLRCNSCTNPLHLSRCLWYSARSSCRVRSRIWTNEWFSVKIEVIAIVNDLRKV